MCRSQAVSTLQAAFLTVILVSPALGQPLCDYRWSTPLLGRMEIRGPVKSTLWDQDGPGPLPEFIAVVGTTEIIGARPTNAHAALFDGRIWIPMGSGLENFSNFSCIAVWSNTLVCVANDVVILSWTGSTWKEVARADQAVTGLTSYQGSLFVSGEFSSVNGISIRGLARWDGSSWAQVLDLPVQYVEATTEFSDDLMISGSVSMFEDQVFRKTASGWESVTPLGVNGTILEMRVHEGRLHIRGGFTVVDGVNAPMVAAYDGTSWASATWPPQDLPTVGHAGIISAVEPMGTDLIVGGEFSDIGEAAARNLARFDGQSWHEFGGGANGAIQNLIARPGTLIAIGGFTEIGGVALSGSAAWNGETWIAFGPTDGLILDVDRIFRTEGNRVYRWSGTEWIFDRTTESCCGAFRTIYRNEIYAAVVQSGWQSSSAYLYRERAGNCTQVGFLSSSSHHSGRCDSEFLDNLEIGLFVSGMCFDDFGGLANSGVSGWNGEQHYWPSAGFHGGSYWGTPIPYIYAVSQLGGNRIVGGAFADREHSPSSYLQTWDGAAWRSLGLGVDGPIRRMRTWQGKVVVQGDFANAGGLAAPGFAIWECPPGCSCDGDSDGIPDENDVCNGRDDTLDADENGTPDCLELLGSNLSSFNCTDDNINQNSNENTNSVSNENSNNGGSQNDNLNADNNNSQGLNDNAEPAESSQDLAEVVQSCGSCGGSSPLVLLTVAMYLVFFLVPCRHGRSK